MFPLESIILFEVVLFIVLDFPFTSPAFCPWAPCFPCTDIEPDLAEPPSPPEDDSLFPPDDDPAGLEATPDV